MKKNLILAGIMLLSVVIITTLEKNKINDNDFERELGGDVKMVNKENEKTIYLAGGCFWGVEGYFQKINGINSTDTGYANGNSNSTTYNNLKNSDHAETVKIDYDISKISLEEILLHYFRIIDPKSINKQGNDIGRQYRTGIYYTDENDKKIIDKIMKYEEEKHGELAVEVQELKNFVLAEDYHQDYLKNNPSGYCHINLKMVSEPLMDEDYPIPSKEELKTKLSEEDYDVIVNAGTERPHTSKLNDEYRKGIYVDKVSKEPLFASKDKFDAGCGWPSFSKPIVTDKLKESKDTSHGMIRTEVRSKNSNSHLGHVFDDGPKESGGLRYCINGASLEFVPYEEMDEKGYGEYKVFCE